MFANIGRIMNAAGGSSDDILKITVWLKDASDKTPLNDAWLDLFPDPGSRPARHTFENPHMSGARLVECEILAVLD